MPVVLLLPYDYSSELSRLYVLSTSGSADLAAPALSNPLVLGREVTFKSREAGRSGSWEGAHARILMGLAF